MEAPPVQFSRSTPACLSPQGHALLAQRLVTSAPLRPLTEFSPAVRVQPSCQSSAQLSEFSPAVRVQPSCQSSAQLSEISPAVRVQPRLD
ncbi:unnamed protein product [Gadus morhua 'NCC']